jgi:hypothetical protein
MLTNRIFSSPIFSSPWARWLIYAAVAAFAVYKLAPTLHARDSLNGFDITDALVPRAHIEHGGPPRDGIPALSRPAMRPASEVNYLKPTDRVLGISLNGDARAYPIRILNWHEVVNDTVGGRGVVISYCPLCGTGMVFDAQLNGRALDFGVSGLLYNSDMLLYDRQTSSLWSQIKAQAIAGPMKGSKLSLIAADYTSWQDWKEQNPGGLVLDKKTGHSRDYSRDPYAGYENVATLYFEVHNRDQRFHEKEPVVGLTIGGKAKVWPLRELAKVGKWPLQDSLAGTDLRIHYRAQDKSVTIVDGKGMQLPAIPAYWFAWVAFYPDTQVFLFE